MEAQNNSNSSPSRSPESISESRSSPHQKQHPGRIHGVRFRCSLYGWKDNFKKLPMALVCGPKSLGVDRNRWNNWTSRICQVAATPSFGLLARVSCWGPWWTWLEGYACPHTHIISSRRHIRVLFRSDFSSRNYLLYCNCDDKSFCCESGPLFLISSTVLISPLESSSWTPTLPSLHSHL